MDHFILSTELLQFQYFLSRWYVWRTIKIKVKWWQDGRLYGLVMFMLEVKEELLVGSDLIQTQIIMMTMKVRYELTIT